MKEQPSRMQRRRPGLPGFSLAIPGVWLRRAPLVLVLFAALALLTRAAVGPDLSWRTIDAGGGMYSTGGGYTLGGTIGQHDAGPLLSGNRFTLSGGFWGGAAKRIYATYMPLVIRPGAVAPDLVVTKITATTNGVEIEIKNQGPAPVVNSFWIDVYVNPSPVPTHVNQSWDQLATQGMVWGVYGEALPLDPDATMTLTVGDDYYFADQSLVTWPLQIGTPVYAQVDSVNWNTNYGGVPESHELTGGVYNNVRGPARVGYGPAGAAPPAAGGHQGAVPDDLPPR